jgi:hypothetical protein
MGNNSDGYRFEARSAVYELWERRLRDEQRESDRLRKELNHLRLEHVNERRKRAKVQRELGEMRTQVDALVRQLKWWEQNGGANG